MAKLCACVSARTCVCVALLATILSFFPRSAKDFFGYFITRQRHNNTKPHSWQWKGTAWKLHSDNEFLSVSFGRLWARDRLSFDRPAFFILRGDDFQHLPLIVSRLIPRFILKLNYFFENSTEKLDIYLLHIFYIALLIINCGICNIRAVKMLSEKNVAISWK